MIRIIEEKCIGCGLCIKACPVAALEMDAPKVKKSSSQQEEETIDLAKYQGVGVFIEQKHGLIQSISYELLSIGKDLAEQSNQPLYAIVFGSKMDDELKKLMDYGISKLIYVNNPDLEVFNSDLYANVLADCLKKYPLNAFIAGATMIGRSFLPKTAAKIHCGLTADCTKLAMKPDTAELMQTRPAFGGNIMATIETVNHRPQMATVRHKIFPVAEKVEGSRTELLTEDMDLSKYTIRQRVLEVIEATEETMKIEEADIIVTAGRGIGSADNLKEIEELAKLLGGAVGATRAVVDSDWIGYSHQVGQTGKTVCPKLYIAIGASGAIQHLAGMKTSKMIVAVNKDPDAPIFKASHYQVVSDGMTFVREMIKQLKK